jgi:hypothetical protein
MVLVTEEDISTGVIEVPQVLQKLESSVFSLLQSGHITAILISLDHKPLKLTNKIGLVNFYAQVFH